MHTQAELDALDARQAALEYEELTSANVQRRAELVAEMAALQVLRDACAH